MAGVSRRAIIKGAAIGAASLPAGFASAQAPAEQHDTPPPSPSCGPVRNSHAPAEAKSGPYLFFNEQEAAFIEAAVARLIPADGEWPGALEAGVPNFFDKQLGGAWGAGERLYRSGPWQQGTFSQGYQLPSTPAELFRAALAAINAELTQAGTPFERMSADQQDAYLRGLEAPGKNLGGVPSDIFFSQLLKCTIEGFFSDPVYGGNRNMVSWRMIGFPGAYASYYELVSEHGMKFDRPPTSLGEDAHGHVHLDPQIPAYMPSQPHEP
jgi:gluconate 2-dehydrogenase gamma chain